jgi:uncharacterized alkaline shock family protein YloU
MGKKTEVAELDGPVAVENEVTKPVEEVVQDVIEEGLSISFGQEIEDRVFQAIALQCLAKIEGVSLIEGNIIDHLFGRSSTERIRGINVTQDGSGALRVKVEVNMAYGISIPDKAKEIQHKIADEMKALTGLGVSSVHVVFKNLILPEPEKPQVKAAPDDDIPPRVEAKATEDKVVEDSQEG